MFDLSLHQLLIRAGACILITAIHGLTLAAIALALGDRGPQFDGRLTANPLRHLDFIGTPMMILFQLGWMGLALVGVIRFHPYPFAFMLFLSSLLQLILEFVVMVGQDVLGKAADNRAQQTYLDAEAVLHECRQLQHHLELQDGVMVRICEYIAEQAGEDHPVRATQATKPAPTIG